MLAATSFRDHGTASPTDGRGVDSTEHMAKQIDRYRRSEQRLWASVGVKPAERRVRLRGGGMVRVQETGTGPPVLLVHGAAHAGASWMSLMANVPDFRCIALDRPGCAP